MPDVNTIPIHFSNDRVFQVIDPTVARVEKLARAVIEAAIEWRSDRGAYEDEAALIDAIDALIAAREKQWNSAILSAYCKTVQGVGDHCLNCGAPLL